MPHYDAASLATPAAVSHEGSLSVVATGSRRRGNSVCQVAAVNPSRTAFRHYLLAKIAPGLSFSRRPSWPRLPRLSPLGWAPFSPAVEVGFRAVVGHESPCVLLGVFGFSGHRAAA